MISVLGTLVLAFLIGAIPFSFLLARLLSGVDIRTEGSGNIGATNLARTMGPWAGGAGLLLDVAKGVAAVLLARAVKNAVPGGNLEVLAGGAAIVGHIYTPFLAFKGGKGVATGAGVFGLLAPWATLAALGVFIAATFLSRMVSLGSMLAAAALPIAAYLLGDSGAVCGLAALVALLVVARHRANLTRILRGEERRWGVTASPPGDSR